VIGKHLSRRETLRLGLATGVGLLADRLPLTAQSADTLARIRSLPLVTKPIPSSGERIPVVGLGTAQTWGSTPRDQLVALLRQFPALGGKVVDTAPAYGNSETALGDVVHQIGNRDALFLATKVSLGGRGAPPRGFVDGTAGATTRPGVASMQESMRRLQTTRIDLMNVWNLGGPNELLPLLREWKQAGLIRYYGLTTTFDGQYPELLDLMRRERLDFVEVDYAINNRNAADQILPLAADRGIAVLIALPFGRTSVFPKTQNKPVPSWAADIDCTTWAQILLKYLVSHPAVTLAIPGTTSVDHLVDNLTAAHGRMPDQAMRQRIEREYDAL
jgi:aryl-alcohol dehydrogenase-like predicted oxidoreductase